MYRPQIKERGWAVNLRKIFLGCKVCPHCGGFWCKKVGPTSDKGLVYKCGRCGQTVTRKDM
jgi:transposase-like protein